MKRLRSTLVAILTIISVSAAVMAVWAQGATLSGATGSQDRSTFAKDVVLLKVAVDLSDRVIELKSAADLFPAGQMLKAGGSSMLNESSSNIWVVLMKARVPAVSTHECSAPKACNGGIHAGMICAADDRAERRVIVEVFTCLGS